MMIKNTIQTGLHFRIKHVMVLIITQRMMDSFFLGYV